MKKLLIALCALSLVAVPGCGKKETGDKKMKMEKGKKTARTEKGKKSKASK